MPLLAVLRDQLAGREAADRITDIWLLSDSPLTLRGRLLSAIPFFYWRVGDGATRASTKLPKSLLNLSAPERSVVSSLGRSLVQTTVLDPATMPVRASTHAYRANELDRERLHLQEAVALLRLAPVENDPSGIRKGEQDFLIARLELRKRFLGGLVANRNAAAVGERVDFEEARVRSRNWELLRQVAEKTGLTFQPLSIAGIADEFAMLTFTPGGASSPREGIDLAPLWKLLNLRDPWTDERLQSSAAPAAAQTPIPLGVYSLAYPNFPLLLVDFRDSLHIRKHEMTQRSINEIVSGVVGISHFTGWYYYAGSSLYNFVVSRHGSAMNQAERIDCYSSLRVALALDKSLDPDLREQMQRRMQSLAVNPLDGAPAAQLALAHHRSDVLIEAAQNGRLSQRVDNQRRAELAALRSGPDGKWFHAFLHNVTFGLYTAKAPAGEDTLEAVKRARRVEATLAMLDGISFAGGAPEVAFDATRLQASVRELAQVSPYLKESDVRNRVEKTLSRLRSETADPNLQQECEIALNRLSPAQGSSTGIAASVRAASPAHGTLHSGLDVQ